MRPLVVPIALAAACAPPPCNGAAALCDLRLDEVVLPATHNAMSNADEAWLAPNQQHPPSRQLEDGVRGMLLDTYEEDGELLLCHSLCGLGSSPLVKVWSEIDAFLARNPREVLVFVLQDDISAEQTEEALRASGLFERAIVPPARGEPWPTLGELVAEGGRVLVTRESGGEGPAWYPSFYEALGFDTPYSFRTKDELSCDLLRGDPAHALFLVNHWISNPLPTPDGASEVNTAAVLGDRVRACTERWGRIPNLVAVDFYDRGDLFRVVREANGLGE
jgi:hypothetical protein